MVGSERRRHYRAHIPGLQGTLVTPGDLEILDVSISGLRLETVTELTPGERCWFELRHGQQRISVEGEVRWASAYRVAKDEAALRPVFRVGIAIRDLETDGGSGIGRWLVPEPGEAEH